MVYALVLELIDSRFALIAAATNVHALYVLYLSRPAKYPTNIRWLALHKALFLSSQKYCLLLACCPPLVYCAFATTLHVCTNAFYGFMSAMGTISHCIPSDVVEVLLALCIGFHAKSYSRCTCIVQSVLYVVLSFYLADNDVDLYGMFALLSGSFPESLHLNRLTIGRCCKISTDSMGIGDDFHSIPPTGDQFHVPSKRR